MGWISATSGNATPVPIVAFENIDNATSPTYTLGDTDVGQTLRVLVNYIDGNNTVEALTSVATAAVENINDDPTGSVSIEGTVREDKTLTANTDTLADADADGYRYQWQRSNDSGDFENIENATSETYTLGDEDVGREVQVMVSYTDDGGMDESLTSALTATVSNVNDDPSGAVTIDGTVEEDQILTANMDNVADEDGLGAFSYQWQRSNGSGGFEDIENATGQTYTLGDGDVDREVRVQVNYTDTNNTAESLTSDATAAVTNVNDAPNGEVTIDGQATENATLTANTGTLDDADGLGALSYQWQRSRGANDTFENIAGETSNPYTLGDADVGREVRVVVSYTDDGGMDETLTSAATAAVGEDILTGTAGNDSDLQGGAGRQTINGLGGDDTLTGGAGDDVFRFAAGAGSDRITDFGTGNDRLLFEGGLFANLAAVQAAATESGDNLEIALSDTETLTLVGASLNDLSASTVTTLDAKGTDTSNSAPIGGVRIDGTVRQGQQLSADISALRDADGLPADAAGFSYQWQRTQADGTFADIENATEQTYTVAMADVGQRLQVVVRYTDGNDTNETLTAATVSPPASNANDPMIANTKPGTAGNDRLSSDPGRQRLNGFGGDDFLRSGADADILDGGDGTDGVSYSSNSADIEINLETGTATGGTAEGDVLIGIENITSGNGNDIITGNNKDNDLLGFDGNDLFRFRPDHGSDRITDFGTGDDRLLFEDGLFADLEAVIAAASNTDDGNLEITLSETDTLILEGVTLAALTAETVTTLDEEGNDTTTAADAASDAPAFELDALSIDEAAIMRLAASEGMTLPAPELQAAQSASEKLALADLLEPPPPMALFAADLDGYAGL